MTEKQKALVLKALECFQEVTLDSGVEGLRFESLFPELDFSHHDGTCYPAMVEAERQVNEAIEQVKKLIASA